MSVNAPRKSTFRILFVCTGGICRSAFAEILARHLLRERLGAVDAVRFTVGSAGTSAVLGAAMHPFSRAELARWGLARIAREFRSSPLDALAVAGSDLVLTAERGHRKAAVELQTSALRTAFCVREMARLAQGIPPEALPEDPVERAGAAVVMARKLRGTAHYVPPEEDAIPDPVALGPGAHHAAAKLIEESLLAVISLLGSRNSGQTLSNRFPAIDSIR